MVVRLRVQKGSAFAFECRSDGAQDAELQRLERRIEDIEALQCVHCINGCL